MGEALSTVAWPGPPPGTAHPSPARGTHLTNAKQVGHDGLAEKEQGAEHLGRLGQGLLPACALTPQDTLRTTGARWGEIS